MNLSELNADKNGDFELALLGKLQYEKLTKFWLIYVDLPYIKVVLW